MKSTVFSLISAFMPKAAGAKRASVYRDAAGPSSREPKFPCPSTKGIRKEKG